MTPDLPPWFKPAQDTFWKVASLFGTPAFFASAFLKLGGLLSIVWGWTSHGWQHESVLIGLICFSAGCAGVFAVSGFAICNYAATLWGLHVLRKHGLTSAIEHKNCKNIAMKLFEDWMKSRPASENSTAITDGRTESKLPLGNASESPSSVPHKDPPEIPKQIDGVNNLPIDPPGPAAPDENPKPDSQPKGKGNKPKK